MAGYSVRPLTLFILIYYLKAKYNIKNSKPDGQSPIGYQLKKTRSVYHQVIKFITSQSQPK